LKRALAVAFALLALVIVVSLIRYAPPAPAPRDAPRERFSAERAREVQARLVDDGATRSVGTEGNRRASALIVAELEKLGWTVETQRAMSCTNHGMCATVTNVVARLVGTEPALPGVLVSAHYDSVPVSPGASDDGVGTATVLETARAITEESRPRRTVVLLLADGEEAGLLGSDAFVRSHPLASSVKTTVNVDARGSHGPSQMFETSRGNDWLIALMASRLERPVTTSVYYEVYKRMPNDTDFTMTKTIASGVNFANTAGIWDYHTPLDTIANADLGTLQHHGDHVLGMTRAFAEEAPGAHAGNSGDDVWFDVLALGIVRWPERWSVLFALVAFVLVLGQTIRARAFDRGLLTIFTVVPGIAMALSAGWAMRATGALPALWVAHQLPALVAIHAVTAAVMLAGLRPLVMKSTPRALWSGTWLGWGVFGVATAEAVPGASYLFVVPTAFAAVAGMISFEAACIVPAVVAQVLVLALSMGVYEALGFAVVPLLALPTILLATTFAPMLAGVPLATNKRGPVALVVVGVAAAVVAAIVPKFSETHPQRVNVVFRQDAPRDPRAPREGKAETTAKVFVDNTWGPSVWGAPPPAMLATLSIADASTREAALPWTWPASFATTKPIEAKPPSFDVASARNEGDRHRVQGRVRSPRGGSTLALFFPPGRRIEVKVEGRYVIPRAVPSGQIVGLLAVPPDGFAIELDASGPEPITLTLLDRSTGVPPGTNAEEAVHARPNHAVPSQDGDVTVVATPLSI
jgi:hypothetical protein